MIADINVTEKSFGNKQLYKDVRFSVDAKEKVGLIGRNGVGKSTLFGILSGADKDYTGDVAFRRGSVVVATRQEHHGFEDIEVISYILNDLPEYTKLHDIMTTYPETMGDDIKKITEYTEALERFDSLGYYTVEDQVLNSLSRFQIDETMARGKFGALSGGQKRLVEVVKIMHSNAHIALIDEPTNHMDYVAKAHFIEWMKSAPEAMLVITHDRDVLHHVDKIVEIKDGQAFAYPGNYDAYLKQNAHGTTTQLHSYEVAQREIANTKAKVIQFRRLKERSRDPDTIKQFKRRENEAVERLRELEAVEKPTFWIDKQSAEQLNHKIEASYQKHKAKNIKIHGMNKDASRSSRLLVSARDVSLGFDSALFQPITFDLREHDRVELRGRNGAGKTTFIRTLLALHSGGKPDARFYGGTLEHEAGVRIGVYEQEIKSGYMELPLSLAIERMYLDRNLSISTQKVMQLLGDYLFDPGSDGRIPIRQLSGGQKARFQLIAMMAEDPQVLILDEPTNHLDLPSVEELETALKQFKGAIMYVSHDSYFSGAIGGEVINFQPVKAS